MIFFSCAQRAPVTPCFCQLHELTKCISTLELLHVSSRCLECSLYFLSSYISHLQCQFLSKIFPNWFIPSWPQFSLSHGRVFDFLQSMFHWLICLLAYYLPPQSSPSWIYASWVQGSWLFSPTAIVLCQEECFFHSRKDLAVAEGSEILLVWLYCGG